MKKSIGIGLIALAFNSYAGFNQTTFHSRANCLNNESITWWHKHYHLWKVASVHKYLLTGQMHHIDTGWQFNDRVAAIHWAEGVNVGPGWVVWGYHFYNTENIRTVFDQTYAESCNIIDGWD